MSWAAAFQTSCERTAGKPSAENGEGVFMILVIMVIAALIGGFVAQSKGKNVFLWFILCGFFPIALIFLFFMKSESAQA